ncbi:hypothetical protein SUGI_0647840 [Cryptomeria japonica]|nr:hypothetical protein SUGI_0647840 [Cryptomeria japonica]
MSLQSAVTQKAWLAGFKHSKGFRFGSPCRNAFRELNVSLKAESGVAAESITTQRKKRPQNKDGEFYVDTRCIECGACCWMAQSTFKRIDEQCAVYDQPSCAEERLEALQAMISCPTASIHSKSPAADILQAQMSLPLPINKKTLPGVYHCGYHSIKSNGATPYLIVHPKGNILVGSPRYSECLAYYIEHLGGARYMFLTRGDGAADHARWAKRLRCDRIMHIYEVGMSTADIELMLEGQGPWSIFSDFDIIFTPGHSKGSVSLFYKPLKALFTGDLLIVSTDSKLDVLEECNSLAAKQQLDCIRHLLDLDFQWILPGHGRRIEFKDSKQKNYALEKLLARENVIHQLV